MKNFEWSCEMPNEVIRTLLPSLLGGRASLPRMTRRSSQSAPVIVQPLSSVETLALNRFVRYSPHFLSLARNLEELFGERHGTSSLAHTRIVPSLWPESKIRGLSHSRPAGAATQLIPSLVTHPKYRSAVLGEG